MATPRRQSDTSQQTAETITYHCEKCGHVKDAKPSGTAPTCCGEEMTSTTRVGDQSAEQPSEQPVTSPGAAFKSHNA